MVKINGAKIKEIKERIAEVREDLGQEGTYEDMYHVLRRHLENVVEDVELMLGIIEEVRTEVHYAEDTDVILDIAKTLGTNCSGGDIDDE